MIWIKESFIKNEKSTIHFLSKQNIKAPLILDMQDCFAVLLNPSLTAARNQGHKRIYMKRRIREWLSSTLILRPELRPEFPRFWMIYCNWSRFWYVTSRKWRSLNSPLELYNKSRTFLHSHSTSRVYCKLHGILYDMVTW